MKELKKEFFGRGEVREFKFLQIAANNFAYVYQVTSAGGCIHFEVFERKISTAHSLSIRGKLYNFPDKIVYPRNKDFGMWAFTYTSEQKAHDKFNSLSQTGQNLKSCKTAGRATKKRFRVLNGGESNLTVNPL